MKLPEWIPINVAKPPESGKYLVLDSINRKPLVDVWNEGEFKAFFNFYGECVTHWCHIPALPDVYLIGSN